MADFGFGAAGVSAAEADLFRQAATEEMWGKVAQQPFELRQERAKAEAAELALQQERRFEEIARQRAAQRGPGSGIQGAASGGQSLEDQVIRQIYEAADDYSAAGLHKKAGDLLARGAEARKDIDSAKASKATERLRVLESEIKGADLIARHINSDSVKDQASWDRAWREGVGIDPPGTYTADAVKNIQRAALSESQLRTSEHQRLTRDETQRMHSATIFDMAARRGLAERRTAVNEARERRLDRAGATKTSPSLLRIGKALITDSYDAISSEVGLAAQDIADRAKDILVERPGLSEREASTAAFQELERNGEFQILPKKAKTPLGGKTKDKPLIVPRDREGNPIKSRMVKDKWYETPRGPLRWTGTGFSTLDKDEE